MIRECRASILEELLAMGGGRFVPYHKTAMAVAAVVAFLFPEFVSLEPLKSF